MKNPRKITSLILIAAFAVASPAIAQQRAAQGGGGGAQEQVQKRDGTGIDTSIGTRQQIRQRIQDPTFCDGEGPALGMNRRGGRGSGNGGGPRDGSGPGGPGDGPRDGSGPGGGPRDGSGPRGGSPDCSR